MIPRQKHDFVKDALFISYSGLRDFLKCPRSYYLKNRYRNEKTGNRIQIASPYMTLGNLVHEAIKWYLQTGRNASKDDVVKKFRSNWVKYRGKRGGFSSKEEEGDFGKRGLTILDNFMKNKNILGPNFPLYSFLKLRLGDKIILNGKVDFIEKMPDGGLHILDFKTGSKDEEDSTQLHTYAVLAESHLQRPASKISYWYLERDESFKEAVLDPLEEKLQWLKARALEVQSAVEKNIWICAQESLCSDCRNYQSVIDGRGEFQFSDDDFGKDIYFLPKEGLNT